MCFRRWGNLTKLRTAEEKYHKHLNPETWDDVLRSGSSDFTSSLYLSAVIFCFLFRKRVLYKAAYIVWRRCPIYLLTVLFFLVPFTSLLINSSKPWPWNTIQWEMRFLVPTDSINPIGKSHLCYLSWHTWNLYLILTIIIYYSHIIECLNYWQFLILFLFILYLT